jgi:hypothetical protein
MKGITIKANPSPKSTRYDGGIGIIGLGLILGFVIGSVIELVL